MVLDAKDAPELTLDAQSQAGFVAWFNRLSQVRAHSIMLAAATA
jgi:hypothetical protein